MRGRLLLPWRALALALARARHRSRPSRSLAPPNGASSPCAQRKNASSIWTMELEPPPPPVPRRKRAFIAPNAMAPQGLPPPDPEVVLDGFVLLEACRVEDPDEAEKAVLEGCGISSVVSEDLAFFKRLTHLDLGDNHVQLASLAYLPALLELHLDCNGLVGLSCPAGGFPTLEVLNLSYNGVDAEAVATLADLPKLRQLDLSKNEMAALPADMSGFAELQVPPPRPPSAARAAHGRPPSPPPAPLGPPSAPRPGRA